MTSPQTCVTTDITIFRITSYINNLNPRGNGPLYKAVQKIIAKAIPLWNRTLAPLADHLNNSPVVRIPFDGPEYDPDPYDVPDNEKPPQLDGEDDDEYSCRLISEWRPTLLVYPEPIDFIKPKEPDVADLFDLRNKFAEKGLQVIVKLANIHLTPEKSQYAGGTWHVEGQVVSCIFKLSACASMKGSLGVNRMNTFAQLRFTTTTASISPKAALHFANNRIAGVQRR